MGNMDTITAYVCVILYHDKVNVLATELKRS